MATLALAISDVLVMNCWHSKLGRQSNYDVLRTAFAEHLKMFPKDADGSLQRTKIVYVNHDQPSDSNVAEVEEIVKMDLMNVWEQVPKPPEYKGNTLSDFFDITCVGLPHMRAQPQAYSQSLKQLRGLFSGPGADGTFQDCFSKWINPESLAIHVQKTWKDSADVKLISEPTSDELAALYTCDKAYSAARETSKSKLQAWTLQVARGRPVKGYGELASGLFNETMHLYDSKTASCASSASADQKREALRGVMVINLGQLMNKQCAMLQRAAMKRLKDTLMGHVGRQGMAQDWQMQAAKKSCMDWFSSQLEELKIVGLDEIRIRSNLAQRVDGVLQAYLNQFNDSPAVQLATVQRMEAQVRNGASKGPRRCKVGVGLTGMVRAQGNGNLQTFCGYNHGLNNVALMFANDRDTPVDSRTPSNIPPFRIQPKLKFDISV